jgi:hypothetical protein
MVIVDPKALSPAHQFTVVSDGVETAVHEGVLRRTVAWWPWSARASWR